MVSARSAAPTAFLLEAGEPLAASWRQRGKLSVILRAKVRNRRRREGSGGLLRREPDVREPEDLAGADDNKLIAEIGERYLAAGSTVEVEAHLRMGGERSRVERG
jgi:hypothetical protein